MKKLLFVGFFGLLFVVGVSHASAASRFWVGGTGTWDGSDTTHWAAISGGAGGQSVPTTSDDVTFDSLSNATAYTVTLQTNPANCANFTMGAPLVGAVTWAGGVTLTIAGNMNLSGGVAGITRTYSGSISFATTSGTKTITTNGVSLVGNTQVGFVGVGGTWQLQDDLEAGSMALTSGTFDPNGKTVLLSGTSATITGAFTFYNLNRIPSAPSKTNTLTINGGNITVTNLLTISDGATETNRVFVSSITIGTTRTITAASTSISNADFRDITGAGAATWDMSSASGGSGNCTGNSMKALGTAAFTAATSTRFTNTSGGTWSTAANWSSRVPLCQDTATLNTVFTTSRTVTNDMPRTGTVDWTGATWTTSLTYTSTIVNDVYGSYTLIAGLTYTANSSVLNFSGRAGFTINGNTTTIDQPVVILAFGGTYSLAGNTVMGTSRVLTLTNGTFDANNFNITAGKFSSSNSNVRSVLMGNGTWTMTGSGTAAGSVWLMSTVTNLTFNAGSSTLKFNDATVTTKELAFPATGLTFKDIWFTGAGAGTFQVDGSNTFNNFKDDGSASHSIKFTVNTTTTVSSFTVSGTSGKLISIDSTTTGTHRLVKSGGGTVCSDYLNVQHSVATPGSTWYAGVNSTDNQAVATAGSGWIFTACPAGGGVRRIFPGIIR